ncbi:collagen-like protein, partial [Listeria monocytogenes]|nr:collagen-like protein [Listeria monocytogenes]
MPVVQDEICLVKVSDGNDGKDGVAGKDGVGVAQTVISYAQAASGTTPPTSGWSTSVPALIKGQFLWTKTVWSYTDDTTEVGYTVSYNAKDGNDGDDGIAGKDGVGISNTKIEYVGSSSGTVKPTSGWSTTIPAVPEGSFLWTKTTWSYTDNTSEVGYSVAKMGAKGDQGNQGIPGTPGADGKDGANGQDAKEVISGYLSNESIIVPATAAGSVTDFSKAAGDFIVYEGQTKLSSGITYSKVSETGMTSTINSSGRYTVTALSADVGTATYQAIYKAVTIQKIMIVVKNKQGATGPAGSNGTDGKGIVSSATTYQAGTSGTTPPNGTWSSSIPSVSENQYLWTRVVLTYSDNTTSTAYSVGKMGAKGATGATGSTGAPGATGNGIKSTTINFASSTSGTVAPSSGWITSIPTVAAGNFLWTRTILTFTDNSTNTSYTVAKQGEKGDP